MQYYHIDIPGVQINNITIREIILRRHAENKKNKKNRCYSITSEWVFYFVPRRKALNASEACGLWHIRRYTVLNKTGAKTFFLVSLWSDALSLCTPTVSNGPRNCIHCFLNLNCMHVSHSVWLMLPLSTNAATRQRSAVTDGAWRLQSSTNKKERNQADWNHLLHHLLYMRRFSHSCKWHDVVIMFCWVKTALSRPSICFSFCTLFPMSVLLHVFIFSGFYKLLTRTQNTAEGEIFWAAQ